MAQGQQDLVPRNLPYGGRQQFVQASRQAGLPLSSATGRANPPVPTRGAAPNAAETVRPDMDVFDYITPGEVPGLETTPEGRMDRLVTEISRLAVQSPNPMIRGWAAAFLRRRLNRGNEE